MQLLYTNDRQQEELMDQANETTLCKIKSLFSVQVTYSLTHSLTYSLTYLLTYSLTYLLTHLLNYLPTQDVGVEKEAKSCHY